MANADTATILAGSPTVQPVSALQTLTGWQDYANKVATNAQIKQQTENAKLENQKGQQELGSTMTQRHNQIMFGLSMLPDQELPGAVKTALDKELADGNIDQQRYANAVQQLQATGNNPAAIRKNITSGLVSNLAGPQALAALTPKIDDTNVGGQMVPRVTPSAVDQLNGTVGVANAPGAINRSIAPQYLNAGDAQVPVGGANPTPVITQGTSPEQRNSLVNYTDPNTGMAGLARQGQLGGMVQSGLGQGQGQAGPAQANQPPPPGGYRLPGSGTQTPQPGGPMGTGGQGQGGLLSNGPVVVNPQAIQSQADTYKNFNEARDAQPLLKTSEQTLLRVHQELQNVTTGPGTDVLQKYRNYISTLNGVMGGKISATDISAGNYDELNKDLNQLVAQAGSGAKFVGNLDAITHGNPNTLMNRLANSNVTSILLGQNRQKQLEYAMTKDQNSGRDFQQARQSASNLDPRALGLDAMSPQMKAETLKEINANPEAAKKFFRTIAVANKLGIYNSGPGPVAPQPSSQPAQGITGNALQGINGQ